MGRPERVAGGPSGVGSHQPVNVIKASPETSTGKDPETLQVPIPALNEPQEHQNASKVKPGGVKVHHCRSQECPEASKCTPRIAQMHPKRFQ